MGEKEEATKVAGATAALFGDIATGQMWLAAAGSAYLFKKGLIDRES